MNDLHGRASRLTLAGAALAALAALAAGGCSTGDDSPPGDPATITGKITYDFVPATYDPATEAGTLRFDLAQPRPVRNGTVQVRQGASVLATTTTDEQGDYTVTFTPTRGAEITLVALAKTTSPPIQVEDNTDGNAVWATSKPIDASSGTRNLHATHGWTGSSYDAAARIAAPFAILDSMYTAARAFLAVRSPVFPLLKVNWSPNNSSQLIGTSYYDPVDGEIYILGLAGADTDEFDSHVIVHEWGHYLEDRLSRADSPGGPHGFGDVLDPRLALSEGYANALAAIVLPEPVYADTLWSGQTIGAFGFDAETAPPPAQTDDPSPGPFSEMSVMRLLYDLWDPGTNEAAFDSVSVGLGRIYDVLVGPEKATDALTTVGSFIAGLEAQPGVDATAVNALLAHTSIGPITTEWGDGDTALRAMFRNVGVPSSSSVTLVGLGTSDFPTLRGQYAYFVFTAPGTSATVTSTSTRDVDLAAYRKGALLGFAAGPSGNETLHFATVAGNVYVVVLTGWAQVNTTYAASVAVSAP